MLPTRRPNRCHRPRLVRQVAVYPYIRQPVANLTGRYYVFVTVHQPCIGRDSHTWLARPACDGNYARLIPEPPISCGARPCTFTVSSPLWGTGAAMPSGTGVLLTAVANDETACHLGCADGPDGQLMWTAIESPVDVCFGDGPTDTWPRLYVEGAGCKTPVIQTGEDLCVRAASGGLDNRVLRAVPAAGNTWQLFWRAPQSAEGFDVTLTLVTPDCLPRCPPVQAPPGGVIAPGT